MDPSRRFRSTSAWQRVRARVIARDGRCMVCGHEGSKENPLTAGHRIAVSRGGSRFDPNNLRAECRSCNSSRGAAA